MRNKRDLADTVFENSFKEFLPSPSSTVWDGLQHQLLEKKASEQRARRKRIILLFSFISGVVILGSAIGLNFYTKNENKEVIASTLTLENALAHEASDSEKDNAKQTVSKKYEQAIFSKKSNENELVVRDKPNFSESNKIVSKEKFSSKAMVVIDEKEDNGMMTTNISEEMPFGKNEVSIDSSNLRENQIESLQLGINELDKLSLSETNLTLPKILPVKSSKLNRLSVSAMVSRSRFNRKLNNNENVSGNSNESKEFFDLHESANSGWSYGVRIGAGLKKKFRLETGLSLVEFSMISNYDVPAVFDKNNPLEAVLITSFNSNNIQFELENTNGLEDGDLITLREKTVQKIRWVNLPVMVGYKINSGLFEFNFSGGMTANFITSSRLKMSDSNSEIRNFRHTYSEDAGKLFFGYRGEMNLQYYTNSKTALFIGGYFENALTPANKQKAVKFYPSSIGWQAGVKRLF